MSELVGRTGSIKENSPLEVIYDRITSHNTSLSVALVDLTNALDKMVGPVPTKESEAAAEPPMDNSIAKIGLALDGQNRLLHELTGQVNRVIKFG